MPPHNSSGDKPRQHIKKKRHYFANRGLYSQSYGFPSSHVQMWELDHKEGWALKNWCFQTVVLKKTLESPVDCKDIKPVNPKGNETQFKKYMYPYSLQSYLQKPRYGSGLCVHWYMNGWVVHRENGTLLNHKKNEIMPFATTGMGQGVLGSVK